MTNCKAKIAKTLSPSCRVQLVRDCLLLKGIKVDAAKDGLNVDGLNADLNALAPVADAGVKDIVFGVASIICTTLLYVF